MTKAEVKAALQIATSDEDLSLVDMDPLLGCGLAGFSPVTVTLKAVARFLRWQVVCLNGEMDNTELNNLAPILRHRITVV